jgi:uncharacterized protein DUF4351
VIARLLRIRFDELPEPVHARLRTASLEQLDAWSQRLLEAGSLDEVFSCPQSQRANS